MSKTKVDLLGDRLRKGSFTEADLRLLDEYRRSFRTEYDTVIQVIRVQLGFEPTGRPAKSTSSIVEKLERETIRLSQMQDIAGCRIVVDDVVVQERDIATLRRAFPEMTVVDRRVNPSHGYRAVHLVVRIEDKLIEVQLRTKLQHHWAELSEKLSDVFDPAIKYGGGEGEIRTTLLKASDAVASWEALENRLVTLPRNAKNTSKIQEIEEAIVAARANLLAMFTDALAILDEGQEDDLSD